MLFHCLAVFPPNAFDTQTASIVGTYMCRIHVFYVLQDMNLTNTCSSLVHLLLLHGLFLKKIYIYAPTDLNAVITLCEHLQGPHTYLSSLWWLSCFFSWLSTICWRKGMLSSLRISCYHSMISSRSMRDRFLSIAPNLSSAHTFMEFYFWFMDPYS